jgi:hypothetical protein
VAGPLAVLELVTSTRTRLLQIAAHPPVRREPPTDSVRVKRLQRAERFRRRKTDAGYVPEPTGMFTEGPAIQAAVN